MRNVILFLLTTLLITACSDEASSEKTKSKTTDTASTSKVFTASDNLYQITASNLFEDKIAEKEEIAPIRLPGTPTDQMSLLLLDTTAPETTDEHQFEKSNIIYGISLEIPQDLTINIEQMKASLTQAVEALPSVKEHTFTDVVDSNNQLRYNIIYDLGDYEAYEKCQLYIQDKIITVCAATNYDNREEIDAIINSTKFK